MYIRPRKLKNGKCHYQVILETGDNIQRDRHTKTFSTLKEAQAYYNQQRTDILNGTYIAPNKITLSQALDEWMTTQVEPVLAPATVVSYRSNIKNHIKPALGDIAIQKLTPISIQNFYNMLDRQKNLSQRSIKYIHDNLHSCLTYFVNFQKVQSNACDFVKVPKKKSTKPKNDFYTPEEVKELLNSAENTMIEPIVYLGLLGLRRSEIAAVTWDDLNTEQKTLTVNKNVVVADKELIIGSCKTQSSIREVSVPEAVVAKLTAFRNRQRMLQSTQIGSYHDNNLIVCKKDGSYCYPSALSKMFHDHLKKYQLRSIRLHDLRHTYCSLAINYYHIPATTVARQVGHSSPRITMDTYSHSSMELQQESSVIFNDMLFQQVKKNA